MREKSLRAWIAILEKENGIKHIQSEVSLIHQLAGLGKKADTKFALFFDKPAGHTIPVITGIASTRAHFALALGVQVGDVADHFAKAQDNPIKCTTIPREKAPAQEVVTTDVDLSSLPIPTHHEKDAGPYITAGILIAKDPETGEKNVSIHRLQVLDKNRLGILMLPRHLEHFYRKAEKKNEPLEIAVAIGVDPLILLASQALVPLGYDELEIVGGLYREPLEVVKGVTVDLEIPAHCEIVLEGRILPKKREIEGPFGEYPKYYGPASPKPVIEISAITNRKNPIYHTIVPATMEHLLLGAIPREASLLKLVRNAVPTTKAVHLTPGGTCRYHAAISIDKKNEGEAKNAMFAAFGSSQEVKHVVVVDTDVDIFDPVEVEWAIATRCQAAQDVFIVPRAMGNKLDPSTDNGICDKMGIDATVPLNAEPDRFERIRIPGEDKLRLEDFIK